MTTPVETRRLLLEAKGPWRVAAAILAVLSPLGYLPIVALWGSDPLVLVFLLALQTAWCALFAALALRGTVTIRIPRSLRDTAV